MCYPFCMKLYREPGTDGDDWRFGLAFVGLVLLFIVAPFVILLALLH